MEIVIIPVTKEVVTEGAVAGVGVVVAVAVAVGICVSEKVHVTCNYVFVQTIV